VSPMPDLLSEDAGTPSSYVSSYLFFAATKQQTDKMRNDEKELLNKNFFFKDFQKFF
jgi:hypothetical protein